jgi:hypothetical protein
MSAQQNLATVRWTPGDPAGIHQCDDAGRVVRVPPAPSSREVVLSPADPPSDGKQTPTRNHPFFVAQHATATCCRGCLAKWHAIPQGHEWTPAEIAYILSVLRRWLMAQTPGDLGGHAAP